MNKTLVIARHEFLTTILRKGYLLTVVGMPLLCAGLGVASFLTRSMIEQRMAGPDAVGLIDRAHFVALTLGDGINQNTESAYSGLVGLGKEKTYRFVPYQDLGAALEDLRRERLAACYLIDEDYLTTGKVSTYTLEGGLSSLLSSPGRSQLYNLIRASLLKERVASDIFDRIVNPGHLSEVSVTEAGQVNEERNKFQRVARFLGPLSMFILLNISIFLSSGYLLQGISEEKQNRVIEVLLSSVRSGQLLTGKIIGLGAAGLLQVLVYVIFLFVPTMAVFRVIELSLANVAVSLLYFILGYVLFAALMAGTSVLGSSPRENGQLSGIWSLISMIPLSLIGPLSQNPNSTLAHILSYIPITAPVTMLLRISLLSKVPYLDVLISVVTLIAGIYFAVKGATRVFRAASLMHGKRPTLTEIFHWLREA